MPVEVVNVGNEPRDRDGRGKRPGSMRGPATTIMRRCGTSRLACGYAAMPAAADLPHARPADGDDAHALVVAVAELGAQLCALAAGRRVEAGHVAGEVEVAVRPVTDARQSRPEAAWGRCPRGCRRTEPSRGPPAAGRRGRPSRRCSRQSGSAPARPSVHRQEANEIGQPRNGTRFSRGFSCR